MGVWPVFRATNLYDWANRTCDLHVAILAALTRDSAQKPLLYQGFGYRASHGFTSGIPIRPANLV